MNYPAYLKIFHFTIIYEKWYQHTGENVVENTLRPDICNHIFIYLTLVPIVGGGLGQTRVNKNMTSGDMTSDNIMNAKLKIKK